jgi:hypothetical protein
MSRAYSFARAFRVEPYGWHIFLFLDAEKWARFVSRRKLGKLRTRRAEALESSGICLSNAAEHECYIGVFNRQAGTLAHEMTHIAMHILSNAGVKVTKNNNEALAYLIGFMVEECTPALVATWKH